MLLKATGRPTEGEAAYVEALAVYKQLAADFPTRPEFRRALAGTHSNLGNSLHDAGRLKEAEAAHAEGLAIRRQLVAEFPTQYELRGALASSLNNIGYLFQTTERPKEATAAYAESMAIYKQLVAEFPDRPEFRLGLAKSHTNLGGLIVGAGRPKEAEADLAESMASYKQLVAEFPNRPEFRNELADGYNAMGGLLGDTGRPKEAEAAHAEALALIKQLAAESPELPDYSNNVASRLFVLAKAACMRRDFAAARRLLNEAFPYHQGALRAAPGNPTYRQIYRWSLVVLAASCAGQGDRPGALAAAAKLRDLGWDPAADAYGAAWTLVRCMATVEEGDKLDEAKRRAEIQFYGDQAMAMLRDAIAKGYKDAAPLRTDKELDPIREREDFKKVVAELEAAKEAPPKTP